ncbi:MAG: alpha-ketoglutarate-dependent dioxygenase AlkB [Bacteroidota bacterium]
MEGLTYIDNFLDTPGELFTYLENNVEWDESMHSRKTASFGVPYNYSQIQYHYQPFPGAIENLIDLIEKNLGFKPNNCLINYYSNGKSTMGWHSDRTDILFDGTGVAIVSIGDTRVLRFREIDQKDNKVDYSLPSGSMIYMTKEVQNKWHHCIPKSVSEGGRISLTFRKLLVEQDARIMP